MQVIVTENGSLCAYKTKFKWCIVLPIMNDNSKDSISCYQVTTASTKGASHLFGIKDFIRNISLEEMLKMIYKIYFSEPALSMMSSNKVSVEDRNFQYILKKRTVKKHNHCVVPLLL